ncbi:MAG: glycosyltransferase family 2 protein [Lachnospiraceae bacterium]|nr:glycosyltransferase family 2 protein [Lachnospiraceae bacterium]
MNFLSSIETILKKDDEIIITGWAIGDYNKNPEYRVSYNGDEIDSVIKIKNRTDVTMAFIDYTHRADLGFEIHIKNTDDAEIKGISVYYVSDKGLHSILSHGKEPLINKTNRSIAMKIESRKIKSYNSAIIDRYKKIYDDEEARNKFNHMAGSEYNRFVRRVRPIKQELEAQTNYNFNYNPEFLICVRLKNPKLRVIKTFLDSLSAQTYGQFKVIFRDDVSGEKTKNLISEYSTKDSRFCLEDVEEAKNELFNTKSDYVIFLSQRTIIEPDYLFEIVKQLNVKRHDFIYTDSDNVDESMMVYLNPQFKPDLSIDLLRSYNYIGKSFIVKSNILLQIKDDYINKYDLIFKCIEKSESIYHIPKVLLHEFSVGYEHDQNKDNIIIKQHLERVDEDGEVIYDKERNGHRVIYDLNEKPLVSIVIANKDHVSDLDNCITSIMTKSIYKNIEFVIVENNSTEDDTFTYYEKIKKQNSNVSVIKWNGEFNYSAINNFGVKNSKGEYILLLNNDTELISEDGIEDMLRICSRRDVGIAGAKLLYKDNTVQHAGVILGYDKYASHAFIGMDNQDAGYMNRARITSDFSAVTAACLMIKKSVFEECGGLDESFRVACNDVDLCLKVREKGYYIVYDAYSLWYHYESKSRGYEDTEEKIKRFNDEKMRFYTKWKNIMDERDPYHNINFSDNLPPFTVDYNEK